MQLQKSNIPGYREYEYKLVLLPPEKLRLRINEVIKICAAKLHIPQVHQGKVLIQLTCFFQNGLYEERIISHLSRAAISLQPIQLFIKGFGFFPTHTLLLQIEPKPSVQNMIKVIKAEVRPILKLNSHPGPIFFNDPHITIARKLTPSQYEDAITNYGKKHFSGKFIAEGMHLLKREINDRRFEMLQYFEFKNMPVLTKQGELFI